MVKSFGLIEPCCTYVKGSFDYTLNLGVVGFGGRGWSVRYHAHKPIGQLRGYPQMGCNASIERGRKFRGAVVATKHLRKWNYNALIRAGVDMMIVGVIQGRSWSVILSFASFSYLTSPARFVDLGRHSHFCNRPC